MSLELQHVKIKPVTIYFDKWYIMKAEAFQSTSLLHQKEWSNERSELKCVLIVLL